MNLFHACGREMRGARHLGMVPRATGLQGRVDGAAGQVLSVADQLADEPVLSVFSCSRSTAMGAAQFHPISDDYHPNERLALPL